LNRIKFVIYYSSWATSNGMHWIIPFFKTLTGPSPPTPLKYIRRSLTTLKSITKRPTTWIL
jgi:hypothetical protein